MKNHFRRGFTLIELLVVIAVIGILAAAILASLNVARTKGNDAAIKRDLASIRTQANIYYTGVGSNTYGTTTNSCSASMFSADSNITLAITHATPLLGVAGIACNVGPTDQIFAVAATLKTAGAGYYCVDSNNTGKVISTTSASSGLVGAGATYALNTTTGLCI